MEEHPHTGSVWHEGELAVQERAGVLHLARRAEVLIRTSMPEVAAGFLDEQCLAVFSSVDARGMVWASLRVGRPGFIRALDATHVEVSNVSAIPDPLAENVRRNPQVGMLVMDFATRRRLRLNGEASLGPDGSLRIAAKQVYSNCHKYIQQREVQQEQDSARPLPPSVLRAVELNEAEQRQIASADTLFIATAHSTFGADASHRGGMPGFVRVEDPRTLALPDYSGNNMFNTLGNIATNPRAGLLFPDFDTGGVFLLSGAAHINWELSRAAQFPGARRVLEYGIEEILEISRAFPAQFVFRGYSPYNPKLNEDTSILPDAVRVSRAPELPTKN